MGLSLLGYWPFCGKIEIRPPSTIPDNLSQTLFNAMASTHNLPADTEKEGNVWCEACQQSLTAARANAHVSSKKHTENVAVQATTTPAKGGRGAKPRAPSPTTEKPPAKSRKAKVVEESDEDEADSGEDSPVEVEKKTTRRRPAEKTAKPAAPKPTHGLSRDPQKEGNYWCGICEVSLTPSKADGHLETARHQANEKKTLSAAMRNMKIADSRDNK